MRAAPLLLLLGAAPGAGCAPTSSAAPVDSQLPVESWRLAEDPQPFLDALALGRGPVCAQEVAARVEGQNLELLTGVCDPVVVVQPLPAPVLAGQSLLVQLAHAAIVPDVDDTAAAAVFAVVVGREPVWSKTRTMPAEADVVVEDAVVSADHDAGEEVAFVVKNHGANAYSLMNLRFR